MMQRSPKEYIDEKVAEAATALAELQAEQARIGQLTALYPDLETFTDRGGHRVLCSPTVNPHVTHAEFRYNCWCCDDAPLELWTYLETKYGRVYSAPVAVLIGERSRRWHGRAVLINAWESVLRRSNTPEVIIECVRRFESDECERQEQDNAESECNSGD